MLTREAGSPVSLCSEALYLFLLLLHLNNKDFTGLYGALSYSTSARQRREDVPGLVA